ncbi:hypothetical protein ACS0TY_019350 [Phlomoides rotata]
MKKFVLNLDLQNDKEQQRRALKTVSTLAGINEIYIDLKGKKLTVIGTVDPVTVVSKLRKKNWQASIISVGVWPEKKEEPKKEEPKKEEAKKEEAKEEPKKEEAKKEEPKKEEAKKEEPKKEEPKKVEIPPEMLFPPAMQYRPYPYRPYYPPPVNTYYQVQQHHSMEENPNACVIC